MHLERYQYSTNEAFLDYQFFSDGPKGRVKKVVRFTDIGRNIYNLGFGDLNEETGDISDTVVTNNNDSRKVLATVAATVNDFTLFYPGAWIFAKGSTESRNRLYRMGISNSLNHLKKDFEVFGLKDEKWETFQLENTYQAFLLRRK